MPDFSALLKKPLNDVKRPPILPQGTYFGVITKYSLDESTEKKTPYVRFHCKLTGPGDDIPTDMLVSEDGKPIDLSKKEAHSDFYLSDDAFYRIKEFQESLGIDTSDRDLSMTLPETINQPVQIFMVSVQNKKKPLDDQGRPNFYNNVDRITGMPKG